MTRFEILDVIQDLRGQGQPFCVATVVRTADLTSAKAGAKAVITAEGEIIGHLGGACVLGAVKRAASQVMGAGAARMITVQPKDATPVDDAAVDVHVSGCPSGGTVDLFIEPYLQPLCVSILGDSPIAVALRAHAALMGFEMVDGGADTQHLDAVVIASQGAGDLAALRQALCSTAPFVAMVASHRKADHVKDQLRGEGMDPARLDQLISPAGLDLGAIDPHEIAISILAQLVEHRRNARKV